MCDPDVKEASGSPERNWLVWFDNRCLRRITWLRKALTVYFKPSALEQYGNGLIYKLLGVSVIALIIPTGGLLWRRLFKWKGWSFALVGPSVKAASEYRYSTCVFETLHVAALLLMLPDGIISFHSGNSDGILKFLLAGILMNGYPVLLQRYNRVRIQRILNLSQLRRNSMGNNRPADIMRRSRSSRHKELRSKLSTFGLASLAFVCLSVSLTNGEIEPATLAADDSGRVVQDILDLSVSKPTSSYHAGNDGRIVEWIVDIGLNDSRVMENAYCLCEVIGSRPSGTESLQAACEWALGQFIKVGLSNVRLEECGTAWGGLFFSFLKIRPARIYNVVADIPGSIHPDEYVIVGAHIDSDDAGTGATDNATGVAAVMEAARLLMITGAKPARTIRFILFSGEEKGKIGSRAYVADHEDILPQISCMFNLDRGTGFISGIPVTQDLKPEFERVLEPITRLPALRSVDFNMVADLNEAVQSCCGSKGLSDHGSFLEAGIPAFQFVQSGVKAEPYHAHTSEDTYDKIVPEYLKHSAVVLAIMSLGIANSDSLLQRQSLDGSANTTCTNER
jgi:hypothetical protein